MIYLTRDQQTYLMQAALDEARLGMKEGEAPIGCVLARGQGSSLKIVSRGHNRVNALERRNAHAEIIAFENAGKQNGKPASLPLDADDVILVSTLEPCVMCLGAAMESGVKLVVFGLEAPADNGTHRVKPPESPESTAPEIIGGILAQESKALFEQWLEQHKGTEQAKFVEQLLALVKTSPTDTGEINPSQV